ncbi:MAG: hypothetical protein HPZ79_07875 [Oscillospiraceae bacterium]|nr:hypothetical protein [Oscillospiraceae bacterium]
MTPNEALEKLLPAYTRYYDVSHDAVPPFSATAEFHSHGEKYILIRQAKMWDMDSHEYVYFVTEDAVSESRLQTLIETAWKDAMPRVKPSGSHRNSDVTLILLTPELDDAARKAIRRTHRSVGYQHGFQGWSNLRIGAIELLDGRITCNRHGSDLKKLFRNIFRI